MPKRIESLPGDKRARNEFHVLVASDWAPIRVFEPVIRKDPLRVYGDLLPVLRDADFRVVNCECALTSARKAVWKSGSVFKGLPLHVRGLSAVPFEAACLANNHVFDYGLAGFRETLRVLRRNGVRTLGAGLTEEEARRPLTLITGAGRISLLNFSEGEDLTAAEGSRPGVCGWSPEKTAATVSRLKKRGDCVVVIVHAGLEYVPYPPPYVQRAFRSLVDAGADCVIGHHPHVPQGLETYKGRLIAYSLGNFVFFQDTDLHYRKIGFCLRLKIAEAEVNFPTLAAKKPRLAASLSLAGHEPRAATKGPHPLGTPDVRHLAASRGECPPVVNDWDIFPYRIADQGLRRLKGSEVRRFQEKLRSISKPLVRAGGVRPAWEAYLEYYGPKGFRDEVMRILDVMKTDPRKGAAMFRNRLTTLQHAELWRDLLTRMIEPAGRPDPEYLRIVKEWFGRRANPNRP